MDNKVIDSSAFIPLYIQVYYLLREAIEAGEYKPGDRMPSENELIDQFSISRTTAIAALEELAKEKLVYRVRGKGTYVAKPVLSDFSIHKSYSEMMIEKGLKPSSLLISIGRQKLDPDVSAKLKIQTDNDFYRLVRVRCADEEPLALQYAYLPVDLVPDLPEQDFENDHLFNILRKVYRIIPAWTEAVVEAAIVEDSEAQYLEIESKSPVLIVWHQTLDYEFQTIEYVRSVYRADRFSFTTGRHPLSNETS
jgi:GntR family transcriptional regulator